MTAKGLIEKVMFAIHIDRPSEVETYFADYLRHIEILPKSKDEKAHDKLCLAYTNYQVKKAK